jgi:DNA-3-methyladenine glycosylase I
MLTVAAMWLARIYADEPSRPSLPRWHAASSAPMPERRDLSPVGRNRQRCGWARNELAASYHDEEWGVPIHDDRRLFEFLVLEGMQAGLSWDCILRKRPAFRTAFAHFDPERVARFGARERRRLLADAGIIRNRLKIDAAIANARAFLAVQEEAGSFSRYAWGFVDGKPIVNRWNKIRQVPATDGVSDAWSRDLRARGFRFVGSTIIYAHMQATGMVNDHLVGCFRHRQVARAR